MAIRLERNDVVATIVMDRPEARNAVDRAASEALVEAFKEFERDDALKVAVLWGAGGVFCAGADLKARGTERGLRLAPDGDGPMGPTRMAFTKPTIAAVEGYAVAGGLELSLMCDLRVASETAIFGVFCRRWGVPLIDRRNRAAPSAHRAVPGARHDSHRTARRCAGSAHVRAGQPCGPRGPSPRGGRGTGADHRRVSPALRPER